MISNSFFRLIKTALLVSIAAILPTVSAFADDSTAKARVGIVPFSNYTGSGEATDSLLPLIELQVSTHGFDIVPHDTLRSLMRQGRIRMVGSVTSKDAGLLSSALCLDYLITGSLDFYEPHGNPEVGISVRVFDCRRMRVAWANSYAATGDDYAGLFGIGRIKTVSPLARRVADALFADFPSASDITPASHADDSTAAGTGKESYGNLFRDRIAIIPFDNNSEYLRAGDVSSGILLSYLVKQGYQVVEPGDVMAALAELRSVPRGELSIQEAVQLHNKLDVSLIVTGSVYRFITASGAASESVPEIEASLRLIDALTGRVVSSVSSLRRGNDSETIFGAGIQRALGRVTLDVLGRNWKTLVKERARHLALADKPRSEGSVPNASR